MSFSALDLLGHDFGPDSREVEDLIAQLDATIGGLLQLLDDRLGRDNYVVALTSDHGIAPTPERHGGGHIANEDLLHTAEQALIAQWGAPAAESPYVAWVSSGSVYFGDGVFDRLRRDSRALTAVTNALLAVPGIARILQAGDMSSASRDPFVRAAAAGYVAGQSADLFLDPAAPLGIRAEGRERSDATWHVPRIRSTGACAAPRTSDSPRTLRRSCLANGRRADSCPSCRADSTERGWTRPARGAPLTHYNESSCP